MCVLFVQKKALKTAQKQKEKRNAVIGKILVFVRE